jgi:hypothetical protein
LRQVQEKYELTRILKVYGGITPDHDGTQVNIKVKSPVPMAVAILPSSVAGQLYGEPEMFESAVAKQYVPAAGCPVFNLSVRIQRGGRPTVVSVVAGTGNGRSRPQKGRNRSASRKVRR